MTLEELHPALAEILLCFADSEETVRDMLATLPEEAATNMFALQFDGKTTMYVYIDEEGESNPFEGIEDEHKILH